MTLQAGRSYEIRLNNADGDFNSVSGYWDKFRWWSPDLFKHNFNFDTEDIPLSHGGIAIGDGSRESRTTELIGNYIGLADDADEHRSAKLIYEVYRIFEKLNYHIDEEMYLDFEAGYSSILTQTKRLFIKPKSFRFIPAEYTRYTAGEVSIVFEASDPDFYETTLRTASASSAGASAQCIVTKNEYATNKFSVKVENIDGSSFSNPTASCWTTGQMWYISDSISGNGDYWLIDHYEGTVTKYVDGVGTNAIDTFNGSFFEIPNNVDGVTEVIKINITSGDTASVKGTVTYRNKVAFDSA